MKTKLYFLTAAVFLFSISACSTRHDVDVGPVEVKPIHITIDINIKVDRALDDFFGDIDEVEQQTAPSQNDQQE